MGALLPGVIASFPFLIYNSPLKQNYNPLIHTIKQLIAYLTGYYHLYENRMAVSRMQSPLSRKCSPVPCTSGPLLHLQTANTLLTRKMCSLTHTRACVYIYPYLSLYLRIQWRKRGEKEGMLVKKSHGI